MGWFDNDKADAGSKPARDGSTSASEPRPSQAPTPAAAPARKPSGSTLGERVHINGTIVCDEALEVRGKVEGKIRARDDLTIAQGADVRAVIQGRRVHIAGAVKGDVHAAEQLVLGPTARLEGNIGAPSLEIKEGAFFKGSVEMAARESKESPKAPPAAGRKTPTSQPAVAPGKGAAGATAKKETSSAAKAPSGDGGKEGDDRSGDKSAAAASVARGDGAGK